MAKQGSRHSSAVAILENLAANLQPGARLPGIRDLMAEHGFSLATMTSAIEELERKGVLVRRHGKGVYVLTPKAVCPYIILADPAFTFEIAASPFWSIFLQSILHHAERAGAPVNIHFLPYRPEAGPRLVEHSLSDLPVSVRDLVLAQDAQGVMLIGFNGELFLELNQRGIPTMSYAGPGIWELRQDWPALVDGLLAEVAAAGAASLLQWNGGEWRGGQSVAPAAEKHGFRLHGESAMKDWESDRPWPSLAGNRVRASYDRALALFGGGSRLPEAILSLDDGHTLGLLAALAKLGAVPGRDVVIATHSNRATTTLLEWDDAVIRGEFDPCAMGAFMVAGAQKAKAGFMPRAADFPGARIGSTKHGPTVLVQPEIIRPFSPRQQA